VHERQRDEFGEATGSRLEFAGGQNMGDPVFRLLDAAEHDGDVRAQPESMCCLMHHQPLLGSDLVRAQHGPDVVVQDLRGGSGKGGKTGIFDAL
jgi:hypothetical protein